MNDELIKLHREEISKTVRSYRRQKSTENFSFFRIFTRFHFHALNLLNKKQPVECCSCKTC